MLKMLIRQAIEAMWAKAFRGLPVAERMPEPTEEQRAWYGRRPTKVRAMSDIGCRSMMASNAFHDTGRSVAIPGGVPFAEPFTTRHAAHAMPKARIVWTGTPEPATLAATKAVMKRKVRK